MQDLINIIQLKHCDTGITIRPAASVEDIKRTELQLGFTLPDDFKEFYLICNGFECKEDFFNFIPLEDLKEYQGKNWTIFAEYLIYADVWSLRVLEEGYEIFYDDGKEIVLTTSLREFLEIFFTGNVFEKGGLVDWIEEKKKTQNLP